MTEWQPIETAPRDGTFVLLFGPDGIDMGKYEPWAADYGSGWERFRTAEYDNDGVMITHPTHWMPLPPPPKE